MAGLTCVGVGLGLATKCHFGVVRLPGIVKEHDVPEQQVIDKFVRPYFVP